MTTIKRTVNTYKLIGRKAGKSFWNLYGIKHFIGISVLTASQEEKFSELQDPVEKEQFLLSNIIVDQPFNRVTGYWPVELITDYKDVPNTDVVILREVKSNKLYAINHTIISHLGWWYYLKKISNKNHWEFKTIEGITEIEPRDGKDKQFMEKKLSCIQKPSANTKLLVKIHSGTGRLLFKMTGSLSLKS